MLIIPAVFLIAALMLVALYLSPFTSSNVVHAQQLDFGNSGGSKGGSGDFTKFVPQGGRALIGTIPDGIKDLKINLTAKADLDIELWDGKTFVVGWESDGIKANIYSNSKVSGKYNGVGITWSGWDGVNGAKGNEYIELTGITKNDFVMKVFGYRAGDVKVVYTWEGTGSTPSASGTGSFSKSVPLNDRAIIGTIPQGIQDLKIDLKAKSDLDIELWDGKTFVVGWQANGVNAQIYSATKVSGKYNGVGITWSGWNGVDGQRGNEYIQLSGITGNDFLMKVFAFQQGSVQVDYSWGTGAVTQKPTPTPSPTATPTPHPTPTPTPTPAPSGPVVRTFIGGFQGSWSDPGNWSPAGLPIGEDQIVIQGASAATMAPILDVDFTLTTGSLDIGAVNSLMTVASGVNFINNGTVTALGSFGNGGTVVNNGVFNNSAVLHASSGAGTFTNTQGAVFNNDSGGSSVGIITNACGGVVNDLGELWVVSHQPCIWSGGGANDNYSDPANWEVGSVPSQEHPILIDGEAGGDAVVFLDVDLNIQRRSMTIESGDTLTIGPGVKLWLKQPSGILINRGAVRVVNQAWMAKDPLATLNNLTGVITNSCRGIASTVGVFGNDVVNEPCFWDGGGSTNNWSEAANWDSNTLPEDGDVTLIGDLAGTVNMDINVDLSQRGQLTIASGRTVVISEGATLSSSFALDNPKISIDIQGTLDVNGGTFDIRLSSRVINSGTININGGTLNNHGDSFLNEESGQINNNGGLFSNDSGDFRNLGTLTNNVDSTFDHDGWATLTNLGTFINHGFFDGGPRGAAVTHRGEGLWINTGMLHQGGVDKFSVWDGARLENSGHFKMLGNEFDLRGIIDNSGTLEVFHFGTFRMVGALVENHAGATVKNSGTLTMSSASVINNFGSVINESTMTGAGTVNNQCGGSFTGTTDGAQPVDVCAGS